MKTQIVKSECTGVFPLLGSKEESKNRKIRISKTQPYNLALVGFRLTPLQAIEHATNVLKQAMIAQEKDEKRGVLDILARRKDGGSMLTVQVAIAPPEKKKKAPSAKATAAKSNGHAAASVPITPKIRQAKPVKPVVPAAEQDTQKAAEAA